MTTSPVVRPTAFDSSVVDDAEAVLRDGALNDHLPGVQALREAWTMHRQILRLAAEHPMALPAFHPNEARRVRQTREIALPPVDQRCPISDPIKGPCTKPRHEIRGRSGGHQYFNSGRAQNTTLTTSAPAIPSQRSAPPERFDEAG